MSDKDFMLTLDLGTKATVRIDRDSDWIDVIEDASAFADTGIEALHTVTTSLANGLISEGQAVSSMYSALNSLRLSKSLLDAATSHLVAKAKF